MKSFPYRKVDAFTSGNSKGNPAAYLFLGKNRLTEQEMLAFGKDHKGFVSEVVFCSASEQADVKLTYYSSECEVDFCGHGTVAAMYDILRDDDSLRRQNRITVETNRKGLLTVYNRLNSEDAVYITAPKARCYPVPVSREEVAAALGLSPEAISAERPLDLINAGLRTLLIPIRDFDVEVGVYPAEEHLKTFCYQHGLDILLVFCMETENPGFIAHTRVFAPKFGYLEDPATGSGNSSFAHYLLKNGLWDGSPTKVEQGGKQMIYNAVNLMESGGDILFGGSATLRIAGEYYMDEALSSGH